MIEIRNLNKKFDGFQAVSDLNLRVKTGSVYGLFGTNGAGKTTVLKHIAGILRADSGAIEINGESVYENCSIKGRLAFIPDDLYFFSACSLQESALFYRSVYRGWNQDLYEEMTALFKIDLRRKLSKFSKGMQKQAAFILAISTSPDYLILDEPIDGLDPLIRKLVWKRILDGVAERKMTVLSSSHNLREMENICDSMGLMSEGRMMIERDLNELKSDIQKVQVAFRNEAAPGENRYSGLEVMHRESRGSIDLLIVRNPKNAVESSIRAHDPILLDFLPLSLEEIFIYEFGGDENAAKDTLF
ncbi:MAG: ABC transporter ATP-binding protein [Clostridiales Family XIII bacterium]|jgi:ABC-2 type transport system ATP-binding protein|nr:ABC transporter ATP-binding protein [Clostridiales Family XIII bacterium]